MRIEDAEKHTPVDLHSLEAPPPPASPKLNRTDSISSMQEVNSKPTEISKPKKIKKHKGPSKFVVFFKMIWEGIVRFFRWLFRMNKPHSKMLSEQSKVCDDILNQLDKTEILSAKGFPVTQTEKGKIAFIIHCLGSGTFEAFSHEKTLQKYGDELLALHPLFFLWVILSDKEITLESDTGKFSSGETIAIRSKLASLYKERGKKPYHKQSFASLWRSFLYGSGEKLGWIDKMQLMNAKNGVKPYLLKFAVELNINPDHLEKLTSTNKSDLEDAIESLLGHVCGKPLSECPEEKRAELKQQIEDGLELEEPEDKPLTLELSETHSGYFLGLIQAFANKPVAELETIVMHKVNNKPMMVDFFEGLEKDAHPLNLLCAIFSSKESAGQFKKIWEFSIVSGLNKNTLIQTHFIEPFKKLLGAQKYKVEDFTTLSCSFLDTVEITAQNERIPIEKVISKRAWSDVIDLLIIYSPHTRGTGIADQLRQSFHASSHTKQ